MKLTSLQEPHAYGPNGEILRYVLNSNGKWLALWNNTAAHDLTASTNPHDFTSINYNQWRPVGKSVNASNAYSWNVSVPAYDWRNHSSSYLQRRITWQQRHFTYTGQQLESIHSLGNKSQTRKPRTTIVDEKL